MVKDYSSTPKMAEDKQGPSSKTLQFILNYSKSTEAKKSKKETFFICLN